METIAHFISGFRKFQENYFCGSDTLFAKLTRGQKPTTMVVACSDSRVDPAILTDATPGELFIVRNVANLVPPYEPDNRFHGVSAALEYGVKHLQVENIIVLGHCRCGGITALLTQDDREPEEPDEFISTWMRIAEPARQRVREELAGQPLEIIQEACEQASILVSLENLLGYPWVKRRVESGQLDLHGWYFNLETGDMRSYLPQTGGFELLVPRCPKR